VGGGRGPPRREHLVAAATGGCCAATGSAPAIARALRRTAVFAHRLRVLHHGIAGVLLLAGVPGGPHYLPHAGGRFSSRSRPVRAVLVVIVGRPLGERGGRGLVLLRGLAAGRGRWRAVRSPRLATASAAPGSSCWTWGALVGGVRGDDFRLGPRADRVLMATWPRGADAGGPRRLDSGLAASWCSTGFFLAGASVGACSSITRSRSGSPARRAAACCRPGPPSRRIRRRPAPSPESGGGGPASACRLVEGRPTRTSDGARPIGHHQAWTLPECSRPRRCAGARRSSMPNVKLDVAGGWRSARPTAMSSASAPGPRPT